MSPTESMLQGCWDLSCFNEPCSSKSWASPCPASREGCHLPLSLRQSSCSQPQSQPENSPWRAGTVRMGLRHRGLTSSFSSADHKARRSPGCGQQTGLRAPQHVPASRSSAGSAGQRTRLAHTFLPPRVSEGHHAPSLLLAGKGWEVQDGALKGKSVLINLF